MLDLEIKNLQKKYPFAEILTDKGTLKIHFENNLDLYWSFNPNDTLTKSPDQIDIAVTKENCYMYYAIEELYNAIMANNPYANNNVSIEQQLQYQYLDTKKLIDGDKIRWYSDEENINFANLLELSKAEEEYIITFIRNKKSQIYIMNLFYDIRISNSGSRYEPYNIAFMNMYHKLCDYDYQISFEEYLYNHEHADNDLQRIRSM